MPGPGAPSHLPDPPPTVNTMRTIGIVWMVVGGVAVLGGAIATVFAMALFGGLAIVLGVALYAVQQARVNSAVRAARTLSNSPPPPAAAPRTGGLLGDPPPPAWDPPDPGEPVADDLPPDDLPRDDLPPDDRPADDGRDRDADVVEGEDGTPSRRRAPE